MPHEAPGKSAPNVNRPPALTPTPARRLEGQGGICEIMAIALCFLAAACHGVSVASIAVAPTPTVGDDRSVEPVFQVVARVAQGRGLAPWVAPDADKEGWSQCYSAGMFRLYGKVNDGEAQFHMYQFRRFRFSPWADSTKQELLDSLRVHFGKAAVRECSWRVKEPPRASGCPIERATPSGSR